MQFIASDVAHQKFRFANNGDYTDVLHVTRALSASTHSCWFSVHWPSNQAASDFTNCVATATSLGGVCEQVQFICDTFVSNRVSPDVDSTQWMWVLASDAMARHRQLYRLLESQLCKFETDASTRLLPPQQQRRLTLSLTNDTSPHPIARLDVWHVTSTHRDTMFALAEYVWHQHGLATANAAAAATVAAPTTATALWSVALQVCLHPAFARGLVRTFVCQPYGACSRLLAPGRLRHAIATLESMRTELDDKETTAAALSLATKAAATASSMSSYSTGKTSSAATSTAYADPAAKHAASMRMHFLGKGCARLGKLLTPTRSEKTSAAKLTHELTQLATVILRNLVDYNEELHALSSGTSGGGSTATTATEAQLLPLVQARYTQQLLTELLAISTRRWGAEKAALTQSPVPSFDEREVRPSQRPLIDESTVSSFVPEVVAHVYDLITGPVHFDFNRAATPGTASRVFCSVFSQPICSVPQETLSQMPSFCAALSHLAQSSSMRDAFWSSQEFDSDGLLARQSATAASASASNRRIKWLRRSGFKHMPVFWATYSRELFLCEYMALLAEMCAAPNQTWTKFIVFREWFWQVAHLSAVYLGLSRALMNSNTRRALYCKPTMRAVEWRAHQLASATDMHAVLVALDSAPNLLPFQLYVTLDIESTNHLSASALMERAAPDTSATESALLTHPEEETLAFQEAYVVSNNGNGIVPEHYRNAWQVCSKVLTENTTHRLRVEQVRHLAQAPLHCRPPGFTQALQMFTGTPL